MFYKDEFNNVYCLDEINAGLISISEKEALEILKNKQSIDELKELKLNEIETSFKNAMSNLDKTPDEERLTFERQEREAREFLASLDESKAPFLKALALSREVPLNDLAQKVLLKADKYAEISATLIGKRQKALDEIKKATTKTALGKIKVDFNE